MTAYGLNRASILSINKTTMGFVLDICCCWAILLYPLIALGDDFQVSPSIEFKQEYTDNIYFDDNNKHYDFISTISPGFEVRNRRETLDVALNSRFDSNIYARHADLNATSQTHGLTLQADWANRYKIKSDYSFKKDFSIDRDMEANGLEWDATERKKNSCSISSTIYVSEISFLGISYRFNSEKYNPRKAHSSNFETLSSNDTRNHGANLSFNRNFGPTLLGRVNCGYARYEFTNSSLDDPSIMLGIQKDFNTKLNFQMDLGVRDTRSVYVEQIRDFQRVRWLTQKTITKKVGGVGTAVLAYKGELSEVDVSISHDIQAVRISNTNGTAERTNVGMDIIKMVNMELTLYLTMDYYFYNAKSHELSIKDIEKHTFRVNPWLRYKINKDFYLDAGYSYYQSRNREDKSHAELNRMQFIMGYKHDLMK